jgi:hypothetical protein
VIRRSHSSGWRTAKSRKGLQIKVKTTVTDILTIEEALEE